MRRLSPLPILVCLGLLGSVPTVTEAATLSYDSGSKKLTFTAAGGETNAVAFHANGGNAYIRDANHLLSAPGGSGCYSVAMPSPDGGIPAGAYIKCSVEEVEILLKDGADTFIASDSGVSNSIDTTVWAGDGDDVLTGGRSISDSILAEAGNDTLKGGEGADKFFGGDGDDTLEGGNGDDILNGRGGAELSPDDDDSIKGESGDDQLYGDEGRDSLDGGSGSDFLNGGEDDDFLEGGIDSDMIWGQTGEDMLKYDDSPEGVTVDLDEDGSTGNGAPGENDELDGEIELVYGSQYDDTLIGGSADDTFFGWYGDDTFTGNGGADEFYGSVGSDTVSYAASTESVVAANNDISMSGTAGESDTISSDIDAIEGGAGDDVLFSENSSDTTLVGNGGNDRLNGNSGDDILQGGSGEDELNGANGDDTLDGSDGDDLLDGDLGADSVNGGEGSDTADYSERRSPVTVQIDDLAGDGEANENDRVDSSTENLIGGANDDMLIARMSATSVVTGNDGDDTIDVGETTASDAANPDYVDCGSGDDLSYLNDGIDRADASCEEVVDQTPDDGSVASQQGDVATTSSLDDSATGRSVGGDSSTNGSTSGSGSGSAVADSTSPIIKALKMQRKRFRLATNGTKAVAKAGKAKKGSAIIVTLSEQASVKFTIYRASGGRKAKGRCRKANSKKTGKRCTRYTKVTTLKRTALKAGTNTVKFSGRIGKRKLKSGYRYRVVAQATDAAGNRSKQRTVSFWLVR